MNNGIGTLRENRSLDEIMAERMSWFGELLEKNVSYGFSSNLPEERWKLMALPPT
jgi:hypothetical protein